MAKRPYAREEKTTGSRKKRRRDTSSKDRKLLKYAALGDIKKSKRLLTRYPAVNVNAMDAEGNTPLHQACRYKHHELVAWLLRNGADARVEDLKGNSPAHLAAAKGHLAILALILQAEHPPSVEDKNDAGWSVSQLAAAAMEREEASAMQGRPSGRDSAGPSSDEGDEDARWQQRLREEANVEEGGWGEECDDFTEADYGPGLTGGEDENAYAARVWAEMERRKRRAAPHVPAAWATANEQRERERQRREAAAARAREASDRILEEERARDAAWREAVQRGDMGARRAAYEARWAALASQGSTQLLRFADIPWLADPAAATAAEDFSALAMYGAEGPAEVRKRLRLEIMRWHPDKFTARFGGRLAPGDRERVLAGVKDASQRLNAILLAVLIQISA